MNATAQMLSSAIVAVLTDENTLAALGLDDVISAPTADPARTRYGKAFFEGFFSGPRQHSRRVSSNGKGSPLTGPSFGLTPLGPGRPPMTSARFRRDSLECRRPRSGC
jgi:hypothetical protein